MLTLLDTSFRVTELTGLSFENLWLEDGVLNAVGKGGRERLVPGGEGVQRLLCDIYGFI